MSSSRATLRGSRRSSAASGSITAVMPSSMARRATCMRPMNSSVSPGWPATSRIAAISGTLADIRYRSSLTTSRRRERRSPLPATPVSESTSGPLSKAAITAARSSEALSGNTPKMVPSATPAASAICRVLTPMPCSRSSGIVAAISAARRSSGAIAGTRRRRPSVTMPASVLSEYSLRQPFMACGSGSRR